MQEFENLIKKYENNFDCTKNLVEENFVEACENELNVKFGKQLKYYILNFGYMAKNYIEFLGINSKQEFKSDMIVYTKNLHKDFNITKNYVVFNNPSDSIYILVDKSDNMYKFDSVEEQLTPLNITLVKYIEEEFDSL